MNVLKNVALINIVIGLFLGVRYISTVVRYSCVDVPLENVEGGDDCPPPFMAASTLGWYVTGGPLMPLWNRDAEVVQKISWNIEKANPSITSEDDFRSNEQKIAVDVTFKNGSAERYDLGTAYGCMGETKNELLDGKRYFGTVDCYYALSGVRFAAFNGNNAFRVERYDESAEDGSITTTTLVGISNK